MKTKRKKATRGFQPQSSPMTLESTELGDALCYLDYDIEIEWRGEKPDDRPLETAISNPNAPGIPLVQKYIPFNAILSDEVLRQRMIATANDVLAADDSSPHIQSFAKQLLSHLKRGETPRNATLIELYLRINPDAVKSATIGRKIRDTAAKPRKAPAGSLRAFLESVPGSRDMSSGRLLGLARKEFPQRDKVNLLRQILRYKNPDTKP